MKDINGNETMEVVMHHTFPREAFLEVNWDNFKHSPILPQILKTVKDPYIHPGVAKEIDWDNLTKSLYLN